MTGGILQLVAKGIEDIYIINQPEISYFKIVYRRYTNFTMEPRIMNFNQDVGFGKICDCKVKNLGDLLHKTYLAVEIPEIKIPKTNLTSFKIKNLVMILKKYNLKLPLKTLNTNLNDILNINILDYVEIIINQKIIELNTKYNNARKLSYNKKGTYDKVLEDIAFFNETNYYFPDIKTIFSKDFKHNKLTAELFELFTNDIPQFAWCKELLHYLIEYVEIRISGNTIDLHDSNIIRSNYIINLDENKEKVYDKMIGNIPELYTYNNINKPRKILYLPINFWFSKDAGNSLPIVALNNSEIILSVKFRNFEDVSYSPFMKFIKNPKLNAYFIGHFIYLDNEERKLICNNKKEYLIERYAINNDQVYSYNDLIRKVSNNDVVYVGDGTPSYTKIDFSANYILNFNNSTKQLFWIIKPIYNNNLEDKLDKFNWIFNKGIDYSEITSSSNSNNINIFNKYYFIPVNEFKPVDKITIEFNGRNREIELNYGTYQYWNPYKHHCSSLINNLFVYNFALYPLQLQPSGTVNMSKLADASIKIKISNILSDYMYLSDDSAINSGASGFPAVYLGFKISGYALQYNIFRVHSGFGGIGFIE